MCLNATPSIFAFQKLPEQQGGSNLQRMQHLFAAIDRLKLAKEKVKLLIRGAPLCC